MIVAAVGFWLSAKFPIFVICRSAVFRTLNGNGKISSVANEVWFIWKREIWSTYALGWKGHLLSWVCPTNKTETKYNKMRGPLNDATYIKTVLVPLTI